ncbi:glycerophosphodiester phosphodiesterase [Antribacter sp. KLBMP9083]|uniref:Glycerophosphodiester phosphodiesterase n=1 Tax=Antribacter soli TaxID=2910976 RepID=A0AA41QA18_9MICO|nr:glycerophosphodiester phosphodiesterase family protein [Antribacter soli]MCF4119628.1 glycerophosphodiester phosphodiesterase [Antribacter soli]
MAASAALVAPSPVHPGDPGSRPRRRRPAPFSWLALVASHRTHARAGRHPTGPVPVTAPRPATRLLAPTATPAVVAHRGNSSVAPQNTLAALESACRAGADAVEIDLQLTADGVAVVLHDATVDATTDGSGRVAALTADRLRNLDAGAWFAPAFEGQRVPTFTEVLGLLARHPGTDLLLELKDAWSPDDVRAVADAIDAAGFSDRVVVQSFWPDTVAAARDVAPHLPRGLLVAFEPSDLRAVCAGLGVVACNPSARMVAGDPTLVARLQNAGLRVMVWTENDPAAWAVLSGATGRPAVDAIITDRPDRLLGWLAR